MKKTIAEFKRRMVVGSKWIFTSHNSSRFMTRTCTVSQSNSFALTGLLNANESSWCDWPKKDEVSIDFIKGKMVVRIFINGSRERWLQYQEKPDFSVDDIPF